MHMYKTIRIYRHGETKWNKQGLLQGWLDSPLTKLGMEQAKAVDWVPEVVYSSDLGRAVSTATLMFPDKPLIQDDRLREIYLGEWQGKEVVKLLEQPAYLNYCEQPEAFTPTSQEPFAKVAERMIAFVEGLQQMPQQKIAVISHGVSIACLQAALEKRPFHPFWQKEMLSGGEYVTLELRNCEWCVKKMTLQKI